MWDETCIFIGSADSTGFSQGIFHEFVTGYGPQQATRLLDRTPRTEGDVPTSLESRAWEVKSAQKKHSFSWCERG